MRSILFILFAVLLTGCQLQIVYVTYNGNGATAGNVPTDSKTYQQGATVTVLGNSGNLQYSGYAFAGWNTNADGGGNSYATAATFSIGRANVTLYAVWIPSNLVFTSFGTRITITGYVLAPSGSMAIPGGITDIGDSAFSFCSSLTSVTFPSSVTSIGNYAFKNCSGLISAIIPASLTSLGTGAFYGCSGLTSVAIPSSLSSISDGAFFGCSGLTSLTISSSVTSIGGGAFGFCSSLTSVAFPSGITSIGDGAFEFCTSLASLTTPPDVTSISDSAFCGCSGLTSLTIHASVTSINQQAFSGCTRLTSVTIPASVIYINQQAFYGCSSLTNVIVQPTTPPLLWAGGLTFSLCAPAIQIHVPSGALARYKGATGWSDYSSQIVSP